MTKPVNSSISVGMPRAMSSASASAATFDLVKEDRSIERHAPERVRIVGGGNTGALRILVGHAQ
jgi:hypothetical protein